MDRNPSETACKTAEDTFSRLATDLQAGRSEALSNYLGAMSRFRQYSWANVLLIQSQRPEAIQVASFHAWHDLDRSVKNGEKGIVIFVPITAEKDTVRRQGLAAGDPFRHAGMRATYVFDVSQTEGKRLPAQIPREPRDCVQALRALAAKIEPNYDGNFSRAQGIYREFHRTPGLSPVQELSALTRELAQAMLRHRGSPLPVREIEAEAVAHVVMRGLGVESQSVAAHSTSLYDGKTALAQSLAAIQEASARILDALLPDERPAVGRSPVLPGQRVLLDAEDFGQLHRQYRDRLISSITGMVRDRDTAEDIAAKAFQRAWEKRDAFRGESRPSTWIEAIARNEARQYSRTREQTVRFDSVDRGDAYQVAAPEALTDKLEKRDDWLRLRRALDQIPDKYRRPLTAHFADGLSIREIASRERVPFGTVLSRIFTGKQLLRDAWETPGIKSKPDATEVREPSTEPTDKQGSRAPASSRDQHVESPDPAPWDR